MRVGVFCDQHDLDKARSILKLFHTLDLAGEAFVVRTHWRSDTTRLDELLSRYTHLVVVYSEHSIASSWLSFMAGFCLGAEKPLVLFRPSRYPFQAAYLSSFFLVLSLEDLSAFLEAERREWQEVADRREARRELLELGISLRGDAFAETVQEGNIHGVDLFLRAGFPPDSRDKRGVPVLCLAARSGNRAMVDLLIDAGAQVNLRSEDRGSTALMDAVSGGFYEIVEDLLEAGTDVNIKSKDDQTALVIAVGKGDPQLVKVLLEHGANPDIPDKLGLSARKYATLFHNQEILGLIESKVPG
ncbi:MAG: ankyrin repeat domain-containing protein [Treponemataceae bacterium]|nr:ankyrin repeat domain-containing protein [Treponemataceae bacterium]HOJ99045.1 ankyrin repeat domain-containing protein [Termitinemataceae bacterium]HOM22927.1 ankyrin repeat domain-containing protein [Termitinemataceae bacterium]HPQ00268.1 ankyrin repeat domain-containing protein [Termitinemataceae bacterium]